MESIKIASIPLEIQNTTTQYVPTSAKEFIDHDKILKSLALGIKDNLPVLMIGESGTGKTSAIRYLAGKTKNSLRRVNLNGGTTADELVGRLLINEKGTYWVDGVLTEAMRHGHWIVLDEINAALPEVLFVLQSVLDDDGYLVLNEKDDKEIVHRHKNFRVFATCNPPEYAGTKEMNQALLSRFPICIYTEFPNKVTEEKIICHHLGKTMAKSKLTEKMIVLANETRKSKELGKADYAINTRDIINTLKLSKSMPVLDSLFLAFANKLQKEDANSVKVLAKLHLPMPKKEKVTVQPITNINTLIIGDKIQLKRDVRNFYYGSYNDLKQFQSDCTANMSNLCNGMDTWIGNKDDILTIQAVFVNNRTGATFHNEPLTTDAEICGLAVEKVQPGKNPTYHIIPFSDEADKADFKQDCNQLK